MRLLIYVLLFVLPPLISCNGEQSRPSHFPGTKQLVFLLSDLHEADALAEQEGRQAGKSVAELQKHYRNWVLKKHRMEEAEMKEILEWYRAHPEEFKQLYSEVITELSKRESKVAAGH
jgi:hypothetical protein